MSVNFGAQIKNLRRAQSLTQEEMGDKLGVSRQAVSNWENDRNLPDIEMLLKIRETFGISLDELITGENTMNNMTEKLIRDGSEGRRSKRDLLGVGLGAAMLATGAILIAIKAAAGDTVDANGVLREKFYLLPIAFCCFFGGFVSFLVTGVRAAAHAAREKRGGFGLLAALCGGVLAVCLGAFLILLAANSDANTAVEGCIVAFLGATGFIIAAFFGAMKKA